MVLYIRKLKQAGSRACRAVPAKDIEAVAKYLTDCGFRCKQISNPLLVDGWEQWSVSRPCPQNYHIPTHCWTIYCKTVPADDWLSSYISAPRYK